MPNKSYKYSLNWKQQKLYNLSLVQTKKSWAVFLSELKQCLKNNCLLNLTSFWHMEISFKQMCTWKLLTCGNLNDFEFHLRKHKVCIYHKMCFRYLFYRNYIINVFVFVRTVRLALFRSQRWNRKNNENFSHLQSSDFTGHGISG